MIKQKIKYEYIVFFFLILICYANVISRPQIYYDDYSNVFVPALLGNGLNLKSIINALLFDKGGFRPISYLSFYLNNYLFSGSLKSFIVVNVLIHFINSIIYYEIACKLTNNKKLSFIIILFWAVNPVNLFAVTYIVQRMTSLMALFGGIATLYYLEWWKERKTTSLLFCLFFLVLANLTKENAFLFSGFFITHYYLMSENKKVFKKIYLTGFLFLVFLYIFSENYFAVQFINRDITPWNRFLTEFRVLVLYLQNIFFPLQKNIYLIADIKTSTSLLTPVSTLLSLIFLIVLLIASYLLYEKDRIISLGILGFFLFHLIESTFLPLYTIFFHRNYIASFFIIMGTFKAIGYLKNNKLQSAIFFILILNAMWVTIIHNLNWYYKPYYIKQNYKSYPESIVAKTQYAIQLQKEGEIDKALRINLELLQTNQRTLPFISLVEIFHIKGLNKEAISIANIYPHKDPELKRILALCYISLNQLKKAQYYFESYLEDSFSPSVLFDYLSLLYSKNHFDEVVFKTEKYENQRLFRQISNKSIARIYNIDNIFTKIILLKIECKIRINLENEIKKDIELLKSKNLYNVKIKNYIEALLYIKEGKLTPALNKLNSLTFKKINDLSLFLTIKKITFILCIYDKTGQENKFKKLIEKISKNTILYNSIWRELDKCY